MQINKLTHKKCKPCEGGTKPMTDSDIKKYLKLVNNWIYVKEGGRIEKTYTLKNFITCIKLINEIAQIAEEEGHHPDILLYNWNNIKVSLTTHAIKGLSENDFILAAKIDLLSYKFMN